MVNDMQMLEVTQLLQQVQLILFLGERCLQSDHRLGIILQQDSYNLHLTHEPLSPPRVNTKTFGERSFSYAGPSVWKNLPQTLHHSDSTSSFNATLKTHLFNNYF